ncbi:MAG: DUF393 domain-containing protein [Armatimonadetes bacterium]|nr:DUF393 domain-containing protein [Armatimonadota bacterium]
MEPWKLYYDGVCNLCYGAKSSVEKWAEKSGQPLETMPLQWLEEMQGRAPYAMILDADGKRYEGVNAWAKLTTLAPAHVRLAGLVSRIPIIHWFFMAGYWVVAKTRYRFFGKRSCPLRAPKP